VTTSISKPIFNRTLDNISHLTSSLTTALFMSIAYAPESDEGIAHFADLSEQAVGMLAKSLFPGAQVVNALPIRTLVLSEPLTRLNISLS
jgi:hypothetical protein